MNRYLALAIVVAGVVVALVFLGGGIFETVGDAFSNATDGIGLTTPDAKKSTKEELQPCTSNDECKNGACGRIDAASGALVCCPSGSIVTYAGYDYCTQIPAGGVCWSDVMCASGYCQDNNGGLQKGRCVEKGAAGQPCTSNSDCKNNTCGRQTAADGAPLVCCPSGDTRTYGGYDYCSNMPNGSTCWSDAMCASDYCGGNAGGLQRGTCENG